MWYVVGQGGYRRRTTDILQFLVDGQTRSKFYSSERFIDDQIHCMTPFWTRIYLSSPTQVFLEVLTGFV